MAVTVKTYRHIVLEFRSTGAAAEEVNQVANAKTEAILQDIGRLDRARWIEKHICEQYY